MVSERVCSATSTPHQQCTGRTARDAAVYPFAMCRAILEGLRKYLDNQGRRRAGVHAVLPAGALGEEDPRMDEHLQELFSMAMQDRKLEDVVDATTGQILRAELVRQARALEMEYFRNKKVYSKKPMAEAIKRTGKPPITVKWVDVNKGDDSHPNYRGRLVAREIRKKWEDSIVAPTPPLEALRTLLSIAATKGFWPDRI